MPWAVHHYRVAAPSQKRVGVARGRPRAARRLRNELRGLGEVNALTSGLQEPLESTARGSTGSSLGRSESLVAGGGDRSDTLVVA